MSEEQTMSDTDRPEAPFEPGGCDPRAGESRTYGPAAPTAAGMWEPSQRQLFDPRRKSPFLAAALAVVPGVGQLYIGYYLRGCVAAAAFLTAVLLGGSSPGALSPAFGMSAVFIRDLFRSTRRALKPESRH